MSIDNYKLINYTGCVLIKYKDAVIFNKYIKNKINLFGIKNNQYVTVNKDKIFIDYKGICDVSDKEPVFHRKLTASKFYVYGDYYAIKYNKYNNIYFFSDGHIWHIVKSILANNIMCIEILHNC